MRHLAALYGGSAAHHRALTEPKYAKWLAGTVYLPDLATAELDAYDGVIVPERMHAGKLAEGRHRLVEVLERGATVVVFGEQSVYGDQPLGWLPGIDWEHRPTLWWWLEPGATSPLVAHHPDHDLWRHLCLPAATWHHHGVFRPPPGAVTLISATDGSAVLYIDQVSTPAPLSSPPSTPCRTTARTSCPPPNASWTPSCPGWPKGSRQPPALTMRRPCERIDDRGGRGRHRAGLFLR